MTLSTNTVIISVKSTGPFSHGPHHIIQESIVSVARVPGLALQSAFTRPNSGRSFVLFLLIVFWSIFSQFHRFLSADYECLFCVITKLFSWAMFDTYIHLFYLFQKLFICNSICLSILHLSSQQSIENLTIYLPMNIFQTRIYIARESFALCCILKLALISIFHHGL